MIPVLYTQTANWTAQIGAVCTYCSFHQFLQATMRFNHCISCTVLIQLEPSVKFYIPFFACICSTFLQTALPAAFAVLCSHKTQWHRLASQFYCGSFWDLSTLTAPMCAGYGTYVEHKYSGRIVITNCSYDSVIMLKVLVFSSWVMIAFNWYAFSTQFAIVLFVAAHLTHSIIALLHLLTDTQQMQPKTCLSADATMHAWLQHLHHTAEQRFPSTAAFTTAAMTCVKTHVRATGCACWWSITCSLTMRTLTAGPNESGCTHGTPGARM